MLSSLEERVQRMEKLAEDLAKCVKRMERIALHKKSHARRLAKKRANKMELRATKQFAEKEESADQMEELGTTTEEPADQMEERAKMKLRAMGEMEMRALRKDNELRAKRMGKPMHVADAEPVAAAEAGSKEGKPVAAEAGSKPGKQKRTRTRMVRLNQERVESVSHLRVCH
jgi:hypothetical protein